MPQSLIFASILFVGLSKLLGTDVSKSPDSLWEIQHILNKNVLEKKKMIPRVQTGASGNAFNEVAKF